MSNTIKDAKNAALGAMMDIEKAVLDFQEEWNAPEVRRLQAIAQNGIVNQWDARQPELEAIKAENPDGYAKASQQIEGLRSHLSGNPAPRQPASIKYK